MSEDSAQYGHAEITAGETTVDFEQIASDLRRASDEARREADRNPRESEVLRRKAADLLNAAERIEADAHTR